MSIYIEVAADAASKAGSFLKKQFGIIKTIEQKVDKSLVTNLDKEAERIIIEIIRKSFPDHAIIGEESGTSKEKHQFTWVIDPLDGTHNYIRGISIYGVSIGIMKDDEYYGGAIYMPHDSSLYTAVKGLGAYKNGSRIFVTKCSTLAESTASFDSGLRNDVPRKVGFLGKLSERVFNVRMSGSSARNLTWLAEGCVDLVVEFDDHLWDFAAGVVLVREAGGMVTNHQGGGIDVDKGSYLATNGVLHNEIVTFAKSGV
jgi:myo-inositol-1(or 4)-monophosphatase